MQVRNRNNVSLFSINANDTNAVLDNGLYSCQVTLTISGTDRFSDTSNNSAVIFKGTYAYTIHMYIHEGLLCMCYNCKFIILW